MPFIKASVVPKLSKKQKLFQKRHYAGIFTQTKKEAANSGFDAKTKNSPKLMQKAKF